MTSAYPPYYWLTPESRQFLSRDYLLPGVTPEERVKQIAGHAEKLSGIKGFAEKFELYMSRGWFSLSSPVWANYALDRGLPVSCFGSYIGDDMAQILDTHSEVGMLSKFGGGTSAYFGALRPRGAEIKNNGQSSGAVHFMELFDTLTNIVSQGSVRRGYFTAYLPIEHGDFDEFINIGRVGSPIQNITTGVTVSDKFMNDMIAGDKEARRRWAKVIAARGEAGFPYIFFSDTVNKNKPAAFKDRIIYASNLCSETAIPANGDETFTCVLSSINVLHYDEWKTTDAVETLTIFLDTVCTEFLNQWGEMIDKNFNAAMMIFKAMKFTQTWRALGVGVLGWHSYLQSKMIPFESREAAKLNVEIHRLIKDKSYTASIWMADQWGTSTELWASNRRNATTMAIAPTKSSSFILGGVSQGIEPELSNYYIKDLAKIKVTVQNPYLKKLLQEKEKDTSAVWDSIAKADGSVQHLDFLSELEKGVFKTFVEINPEVVIDQAATRQTYIDQSQSLNLMIDPSIPTKEINKLYIRAWESGVKTLYYQHNLNAAQSTARKKFMSSGCAACEG